MIGPGQGAASFDASGNALYVFFFNQILSKSKWSKTFLTLELLLTDLAKPAFMADSKLLENSKLALMCCSDDWRGWVSNNSP